MLVGVAGEVWLSAWLKYICLMRTLKASNEVHTEIYFDVLWPFCCRRSLLCIYIFLDREIARTAQVCGPDCAG